MQAKAYMEQVRRAESELEMIAARRRHYLELATSIGGSGSAVGGKPSGASRVEAGAVAIVDLLSELSAREREYVRLVKEAESLISRLPQESFRKVLTLFYLAGRSLRAVNAEMGYTDEKSALRCRRYALRELQKVLDMPPVS